MTASILARLIEPTLFAISRPRRDIAESLETARELARQAKRELKQSGAALHAPSFEIGVAAAFVELLATAEQRSYLADAVTSVMSIPKGIETLHVIAFLESRAIEATQGQIADKLGTDRGNFNRRVRQLVDLGLAQAKRSGRKVHYSATFNGLDVLSQLRPGWKALHPESLVTLQSETAAQATAEAIAASVDDVLSQIGSIGTDWTAFDLPDSIGRILGVAKLNRGSFTRSFTQIGKPAASPIAALQAHS